MTALTRPRATVDLDALARNYRLLAERAGGGLPAGVVKADGYGLGAVPVARRLLIEGCTHFFVARIDEGIDLRAALGGGERLDPSPTILVLDGAQPGTGEELVAAGLVPVLNDLDQIERWRGVATIAGRALPAALHFDTGMTRLGIPSAEADRLTDDESLLDGVAIEVVMSHLASADEPGSEQPSEQLDRFARLRSRFPQGLASLANSAGTFLGPEYHHDLIRPGIALYGGAPLPDRPNPMEPVVTVEVPVIQVQEVEPGTPIGYGATYRTERATRLATVAAGYADGYQRAAGRADLMVRTVSVCGRALPILGRVSMDLIVVDVGALPAGSVRPGTPVELLGPSCPLDEVAAASGTIANEVLTGLGRRYRRAYRSESHSH